jgi:precorrin-6A/cobalt-precorrin-6A reductase
VRNKVLLLSGTSEGPVLARALTNLGFEVRATVTRPEACRTLFGGVKNVTAEVRGFTADSLTAFLRDGNADLVLDATHPFAARITRIAHDVCGRLGVPYVRYERPDWTPPAGTLFADTFSQAAEILPKLGQRIMLTIGAKQLKHFAGLHDRLELFARILPGAVSVAQAQAAGFAAERVVCLRPPFSREANRALFQSYSTDTLVTKASGVEGGVVEKVSAALDLGMKVLMIRRPVLGVSAVTSIEGALLRCQEVRGESKMSDLTQTGPAINLQRVEKDTSTV